MAMLHSKRVSAALVVAWCAHAHAQDGLVASDKTGAAVAAAVTVDDDTAPPEQAALDIFVGTWSCRGKAATERAAEADVAIKLQVKRDLGGRWLTVRTEETKSKDNPHPTITTQVWGYSREQAGFVNNGADNHGALYAGASSGWVGDRLSWNVDAARNAKRAKLKSTFAKNGKDLTLQVALDATGTGDEFRVTFEGTCTH